MEEVATYAFEHYSNVRIFVVDYKYQEANTVMFGDRPYCTNVTSLSNGIRALTYTIDNHYCETARAFDKVKNLSYMRHNVNTFIYHIHNGNNLYELEKDGISLCNSSIGIFSEVIPAGYIYDNDYYPEMLHEAIVANEGIDIQLSASSAAEIEAHIASKIDTTIQRTEFDTLIGTTLKKIILKKALERGGSTNSDSDTMTDWMEVKHDLIQYNYTDNSFTLPTLKQLIETAGAENLLYLDPHSYRVRESMYQLIWFKPVLPCNTDPTSADSDGDGINDDQDTEPSTAFDSRFILVNSLDDIPMIDFMNPNMLGYGNTAYDPEYGTPVVDGRDACFSRNWPTATNFKDLSILSIEATAGRFAISTNVAGLLVFGDLGVEMYNAGEFLNWFLNPYNSKRTLSAKEMKEIISTDPDNLFHFMYNMNTLRNLAEETVLDGNSAIFASNHCDNFKICCYTDKHCEETLGLQHLSIIGLGSPTDKALDWSYSIGELFCGLAMDVTRNGSTYSATVKIKLTDYYEWGYHVDGGDMEQHMLHECGLAREYPIIGELTFSMSWNAGQRLENSAYQLYDILGLN